MSNFAATFATCDSLMGMRRLAITMIPVLALLVVPGGAGAARARHALPAKCAPSSRTLLADAQAQVYSTPEDSDGVISLRACAYGQRRSFIVAGCNYEKSATVCADKSHVALVGTVVAYGDTFTPAGARENEESIDEWHVEVRDLRTGRLLHEVPTGTPLKPTPHHVGVGPIVGLVLKSDGSVAWIADDYERSSKLYGVGAPYFDVYATDKTGTRRLASGTNIDPSSLALSVGASGVNAKSRTIEGSTMYWTQGGKSEMAVLN
jgi:hypothetical protein